MWKGLKHECRHWYRGKPQSWVRKEGAHHCFHYVGAGCHIPYILVARNPANGQFHKLSCVSGWGGGWGWDWHSKLLTADMSLGMPWLFMAWGSGRALNARSFSRQRRKSPAYLWLVKNIFGQIHTMQTQPTTKQIGRWVHSKPFFLCSHFDSTTFCV